MADAFAVVKSDGEFAVMDEGQDAIFGSPEQATEWLQRWCPTGTVEPVEWTNFGYLPVNRNW